MKIREGALPFPERDISSNKESRKLEKIARVLTEVLTFSEDELLAAEVQPSKPFSLLHRLGHTAVSN